MRNSKRISNATQQFLLILSVVVVVCLGTTLVLTLNLDKLAGPHPVQHEDKSISTDKKLPIATTKPKKANMTSPELKGIDLSLYKNPQDLFNFPSDEPQTQKMRREKVREAIKFAYEQYELYAFGEDELKPISTKVHTMFGKMGVTLVDSLDTLLIAGLTDPYKRAREWIANQLSFDRNIQVSVFETNIRYLGGLLAAYTFTGDDVMVKKSVDLAERLLKAYTTTTGLPSPRINLKTGQKGFHPWAGKKSILAEIGTMQMEFAYLSEITNDPKYMKQTFDSIKYMRQKKQKGGLYHSFISSNSGSPSGIFAVGGLADSFYEYLLKVWLLTGKTEPMFRDMYFESADSIAKHLVRKTNPNGLTYIGEMRGNSFKSRMEHLTCFAGGMFALGSIHHEDKEKAKKHLDIGAGVGEFCYQMYHRTKTGLSAESVTVGGAADFITKPGQGSQYLLRPEAVETLFILYRLTNDTKYQDKGWEIFEAIEKYSRVAHGYTGVKGIDSSKQVQDDVMQSWFLAETLKYLYLLFTPHTTLPLDKYVLNTEAHPFKIFKPRNKFQM